MEKKDIEKLHRFEDSLFDFLESDDISNTDNDIILCGMISVAVEIAESIFEDRDDAAFNLFQIVYLYLKANEERDRNHKL